MTGLNATEFLTNRIREEVVHFLYRKEYDVCSYRNENCTLNEYLNIRQCATY